MRSIAEPEYARLVRRYLMALGDPTLDDGPGEAELALLHRAHVERFSHDTLWVARGRVPRLGYLSMVHALLGGEGGACVQLTSGFTWLLRQLGYEVGAHRAKVQLGLDAEFRDWPGHVNLVVHLDGVRWYADPGLGNGVLEPIPLVAGTVEQGGFTYALEHSELPEHWEFVHDRKVRAIRRTRFPDQAAADLSVMAPGFDRVSGDADSPFRQEVAVNRRHSGGVTTLSGDLLVHRDGRDRTMRRLESAVEWEQALRDEFLLELPEWSRDERDRLWSWITRS